MNPNIFKKILLVFFCWQVAFSLISLGADSFLQYKPSFPYTDIFFADSTLPRWLYSRANFDGIHYLTIVKNGFLGGNQVLGLLQAFFPFYPITIKLTSLIVQNDILSGLLISNLTFLGLLLMFYLLVSTVRNKKTAWLSLLVLLTFPTSFFWGSLYGESLFLLLAVSSFYFASQRHWLLSGLLAMMASATRVVGIFLVPALFVEFLIIELPTTSDRLNSYLHKIGLVLYAGNNTTKLKQVTKKLNIILDFFCILLGTLGLIFYMIYLDLKFKDPLFFYHVQSEFGAGRQEQLVFYPQVVWRYVKILSTVPFNLRYFSFVQEMLAGTLSFVIIFWGFCKKVPISWLLFSLGSLLLPTLTGTFSSMPRYILVAFPLFILIADYLENSKKAQILWFTISTVLLGFNTILFIQGYWIA